MTRTLVPWTEALLERIVFALMGDAVATEMELRTGTTCSDAWLDVFHSFAVRRVSQLLSCSANGMKSSAFLLDCCQECIQDFQ